MAISFLKFCLLLLCLHHDKVSSDSSTVLPFYQISYFGSYICDHIVLKDENIRPIKSTIDTNVTLEDTTISVTWKEEESYRLSVVIPLKHIWNVTKLIIVERNIQSLILGYSLDGKYWKTYPEVIKLKGGKYIHSFDSPLLSKYIKISPNTLMGKPEMKIQIVVCTNTFCPLLDTTNCQQTCYTDIFSDLNCNGTACVTLRNCPCLNDYLKLKPAGYTDDCSTLHCENGEIKTTEFQCNIECLKKEDIIKNEENCSCHCRCPKWMKRCDGIKDCVDGSDEDCCAGAISPFSCPLPRHVCKNKNDPENRFICRYRGNKIITFSKSVFECSTTTGYLIREISDNLFYVIWQRYYEEGTWYFSITIKHDELTVLIDKDSNVYLTDNINDDRKQITVSPWNFLKREKYVIKNFTDRVQFISLKYGFVFTWSVNNIDIEVDECLYNRIDGQCGYFTNTGIYKELRGKNNIYLNSFEEFCAHWIYSGSNLYGGYEINETLLETSRNTCKNITEEISKKCNARYNGMQIYQNFTAILDACPYVSIHKCASENDCACEALKYFFEENLCNYVTRNKFLSKYECEQECKSGFIWKEWDSDSTCEKVEDNDLTETGGSGCFCPGNLIRTDDRCMPKTECERCKIPPFNCCLPRKECVEEKMDDKRHICRFRVNTVIMFSKTFYQCQTNHGYLLREKNDHFWVLWNVGRMKLLDGGSQLGIKHDKIIFAFDEDYSYKAIENLMDRIGGVSSFSFRNSDYTIKKVSDRMEFRSLKYGFAVTWRNDYIIDLEVQECLYNRTEGQCGYFTDVQILNELRGKNGTVLKTPEEMCGNWKDHYGTWYSPNNIDGNLLEMARNSCETIKQEIYGECEVCKKEMNSYQNFVVIFKACPQVVFYNCHSEQDCLCESLKYFFEEKLCNSTKSRELLTRHECVDKCPHGFTWKECGLNETCDKISDKYGQESRGPGCYCADNLVKIGDRCVSESECGK